MWVHILIARVCESLSAWGAGALPGFLDAAIKGAAILILTGMVVMGMRKGSAAGRHLVWFLGMVGVIVLPILSVALPGWHVLPRWTQRAVVKQEVKRVEVVERGPVAVEPGGEEIPHQAARAEEKEDMPTRVPVAVDLSAEAAHAVVGGEANSAARETVRVMPAAAAADRAPAIVLAWQGWVMLVWGMGSAGILAYVGLGFLSLWWLRKRSARVMGGEWGILLEEICRELGFGRRVELLSCAGRTMPMTWGIWRTRVLLPGDCGGWTSQEKRAVLMHELAHARRWDCLTQAVAQLACAVYWFNPLAWLGWKCMQSEREQACDDLVLRTGAKASAYAEQLLRIAAEMPTGRFSAAAIAMARPSKLEGRLRAILDVTRNRRGVTRLGAVMAAVVALGLVIPMACMNAAENARFTRATIHLHMDQTKNDAGTIEVTDRKQLDALIAFFPQLGEKSDRAGGWMSGAEIELTGADGSVVKVSLSGNDDLTVWSQGRGDWPVKGDLKGFLEKLEKEQGAKAVAKGSVKQEAGVGISLLVHNEGVELRMGEKVVEAKEMEIATTAGWVILADIANGRLRLRGKGDEGGEQIYVRDRVEIAPDGWVDGKGGKALPGSDMNDVSQLKFGRVVDAKGKGVAEAKLKSAQSNWSAVSGADGVFELPKMDFDSQETLTITAAGFVNRGNCGLWRMGDGKISPEKGVLELHRYGRLEGIVLGMDGKPLAGAPISVDVREPYPHGGNSTINTARAISDGEGRFVMENVPPGDVLLCYPWRGASEEELKSGRWKEWIKAGEKHPTVPTRGIGMGEQLYLGDGQTVRGVVLDLSQAKGVAQGRVVDKDGKPLVGALIDLDWTTQRDSMGGSAPLDLPDGFKPVRTDEQGRYRLEKLPIGNWTLAVETKAGGREEPVPVTVTEKPVEAEDIILPVIQTGSGRVRLAQPLDEHDTIDEWMRSMLAGDAESAEGLVLPGSGLARHGKRILPLIKQIKTFPMFEDQIQWAVTRTNEVDLGNGHRGALTIQLVKKSDRWLISDVVDEKGISLVGDERPATRAAESGTKAVAKAGNEDRFVVDVENNQTGDKPQEHVLVVGGMSDGEARVKEVPIAKEMWPWAMFGAEGSKTYLRMNGVVKTLDVGTGEIGEFPGGNPALYKTGAAMWPTIRGGRELYWTYRGGDDGLSQITLNLREADGTSKKIWEGAEYMEPEETAMPSPTPPVVWLDDENALTLRVSLPAEDRNKVDVMGRYPNAQYKMVVVNIAQGKGRDIGTIGWPGRVVLVGPRGKDGDAAAIFFPQEKGGEAGKASRRAYAVNVKNVEQEKGDIEERPVKWGAFTLDGVNGVNNLAGVYGATGMSVGSLSCAGKVIARDVEVSVSPSGQSALWVVGPSDPSNLYGCVLNLFQVGDEKPREMARGDVIRTPVWFTGEDVASGQAATTNMAHGFGHVVDAQGKGIAGAKLKSKQSEWSAVSGEDGSFPLPQIKPNETAWMDITAAGFLERKNYDISRDDSGILSKTVIIQLHRPGRLEGRVLGPDGKPLAGALLSVRVMERFLSGMNFTGNAARATSDANGRFVMEGVPPGNILLYYPAEGLPHASAPTKGIGTAVKLQLADGQTLNDLVLDLSQATGIAQGRVLDKEGKPLADAKVCLEWTVDGASSPIFTAQDIDQVKSDGQGRYSLEKLPLGQWHLMASLGRAQTQPMEVTLSATPARVDLVLPVIQTARGRIRHVQPMGAQDTVYEWISATLAGDAQGVKAVVLPGSDFAGNSDRIASLASRIEDLPGFSWTAVSDAHGNSKESGKITTNELDLDNGHRGTITFYLIKKSGQFWITNAWVDETVPSRAGNASPATRAAERGAKPGDYDGFAVARLKAGFKPEATLLVGHIHDGRARVREIGIPLETQWSNPLGIAGGKYYFQADTRNGVKAVDLQTGAIANLPAETNALGAMGLFWKPTLRGNRELKWESLTGDLKPYDYELEVISRDGTARKVWKDEGFVDEQTTRFDGGHRADAHPPVAWLDDAHALTVRVQGYSANLGEMRAKAHYELVVVDIASGQARDIAQIPWNGYVKLIGPRGEDGDALVIAKEAVVTRGDMITRTYALDVRQAIQGNGRLEQRAAHLGVFTIDGLIDFDDGDIGGFLAVRGLACAGKELAKNAFVSISPDGRRALWQIEASGPPVNRSILYFFQPGAEKPTEIASGDQLHHALWFEDEDDAPATRPATRAAGENEADRVAWEMGLAEGDSIPRGWSGLDKSAGPEIGLFVDDQVDAGMRAIGAMGEGAKMLSLPEVYQQAVAGKIAAGHAEIVGRMEGPYSEGDEFIVSGFVRKGNLIVANVKYVRAKDTKRQGEKHDYKRAYFKAMMPGDLPAGRYYVWVGLSEYFREGGKLVFAPKTAIRAFEYLTCVLDVPDASGKGVARLLPGSGISVAEAMKGNFAGAAVCEMGELQGSFRISALGSNYAAGHFDASQTARVTEVLAGKVKPGEAMLVYPWIDTAGRRETCLDKGQKVIWILGAGAEKSEFLRGVKALADTPENRRAVMEGAARAATESSTREAANSYFDDSPGWLNRITDEQLREAYEQLPADRRAIVDGMKAVERKQYLGGRYAAHHRTPPAAGNPVDPELRAIDDAIEDELEPGPTVSERIVAYIEKNPQTPFAAELYFNAAAVQSMWARTLLGERGNAQMALEYFQKAHALYGTKFTFNNDVAWNSIANITGSRDQQKAYYDWLNYLAKQGESGDVYPIRDDEMVLQGHPLELSEAEMSSRMKSFQKSNVAMELSTLERNHPWLLDKESGGAQTRPNAQATTQATVTQKRGEAISICVHEGKVQVSDGGKVVVEADKIELQTVGSGSPWVMDVRDGAVRVRLQDNLSNEKEKSFLCDHMEIAGDGKVTDIAIHATGGPWWGTSTIIVKGKNAKGSVTSNAPATTRASVKQEAGKRSSIFVHNGELEARSEGDDAVIEAEQMEIETVKGVKLVIDVQGGLVRVRQYVNGKEAEILGGERIEISGDGQVQVERGIVPLLQNAMEGKDIAATQPAGGSGVENLGGLKMEACPADKAAAGVGTVGLYDRTVMPAVNEIYKMVLGGEAGDRELIARLHYDSEPIKVMQFVRQGNEIQILVAVRRKKAEGSNYIRGPLPTNLAAGRYHVMLTEWEYEEKGKLVPAPKTATIIMHHMECYFAVGETAEQNAAWRSEGDAVEKALVRLNKMLAFQRTDFSHGKVGDKPEHSLEVNRTANGEVTAVNISGQYHRDMGGARGTIRVTVYIDAHRNDPYRPSDGLWPVWDGSVKWDGVSESRQFALDKKEFGWRFRVTVQGDDPQVVKQFNALIDGDLSKLGEFLVKGAPATTQSAAGGVGRVLPASQP